jgi:uncharacterized protein
MPSAFAGSLAVGLVAWLLSGCSSPREHLYYLEPEAGETSPAPVGAPRVVVGPISIPQLVDRPQIVVRGSDSEVLINEQARWAAPLRNSLEDLLAAELQQRLPDTRFVPSGGIVRSADERSLNIDIYAVDLDREDGARIRAYWVYRDPTSAGATLEGEVQVHAEPRRPDVAGLVAALGSASRMLAGTIAISLGERHR